MTPNEKLIKDFIDGPLKEYLTGDISYGKFKELINEVCGTNFSYSDLYPSYLFNARLSYEESDRMLMEDLGTTMEHKQDCPWWKDWHACSCGMYDIKECKLVIPGTVIMCGEDGNYCSEECMRKTNEPKSNP